MGNGPTSAASHSWFDIVAPRASPFCQPTTKDEHSELTPSVPTLIKTGHDGAPGAAAVVDSFASDENSDHASECALRQATRTAYTQPGFKSRNTYECADPR